MEQHFGRRKSPRIALNKSFSKFTNEASNPIIIDSPEESRKRKAGDTRVVQSLARVIDMDDDFVEPVVVEVNDEVAGERAAKKGKAPVVDDVEDCISYPVIRNRASPHALWEAIKGLSPRQKSCVDKMGFSHILACTVDGIPSMLGYYVVDKLEAGSTDIHIESGVINITPEMVRDLVGVPMGGKEIKSTPGSKVGKSVADVWRAKYRTKDVSPNDILKRLKTYACAGWEFMVDFVMLFITTMIDCQRNGKCRFGYLQNFEVGEDFSQLDWCGCIVKAIRGCKSDWTPTDPSYYFTGPLTVLTLAYLEATTSQSLVGAGAIAIARWTKDSIRERQKHEIENGGFGKIALTTTVMDGGEPSVEEFEKKLDVILSSISLRKSEFEETLKEAVSRFENVSALDEVRRRYDGLFNVRRPYCADGADMGAGPSNFEEHDVTGTEEESLTQILANPNECVDLLRVLDAGIGFIHTPRVAEEGAHVPESVRVNTEPEGRKDGPRSKRVAKASYALKSPYVVRCVEMDKPPTEDERMVWRFLWRIPGQPSDELFKSDGGVSGTRDMFESFKTGSPICVRLIDCFSMVLNYEERFKSEEPL